MDGLYGKFDGGFRILISLFFLIRRSTVLQEEMNDQQIE